MRIALTMTIVFILITIGCTDFVNPLSSENAAESGGTEFVDDPNQSGGSENGSVLPSEGGKKGFIGDPNISGGSENG
jgi:hypothetical protein